MSVDLIFVAIAVLFAAGLCAWALWDDIRAMVDPRGQYENGLRAAGLSDREARRRSEGLPPMFYSLGSLAGLLGLLWYFLV